MSELSAYLDTRPDINVSFTFIGLLDRPEGRFDLAWSAMVNGERFDYFTGCAWLKNTMKGPIGPRHPNRSHYTIDNTNKWITADEAINRGIVRPKEPDAADLLSCLVSDAQSGSQTFAEWCSELGYDEDSRRALATYLACQEAGAKLVKAIGRDTFNALCGLEH